MRHVNILMEQFFVKFSNISLMKICPATFESFHVFGLLAGVSELNTCSTGLLTCPKTSYSSFLLPCAVWTNGNKYLWCDVLTAVVMKSSALWYIMPCSPVKARHSFGGTCCIHLQGWRVSQARSLHETGSKQSLLCNPEDGSDMLLQSVR
jgi:hypothetical protein